MPLKVLKATATMLKSVETYVFYKRKRNRQIKKRRKERNASTWISKKWRGKCFDVIFKFLTQHRWQNGDHLVETVIHRHSIHTHTDLHEHVHANIETNVDGEQNTQANLFWRLKLTLIIVIRFNDGRLC